MAADTATRPPTPRTRPVHVGSIPLPFCPCSEDSMDVVHGGTQLLLLDASEGVFHVMDALGGEGRRSTTFTVDAPTVPRRFCATPYGTLFVTGDCVAGLWEVYYLSEDVELSGAGVRLLHTAGVPTAVSSEEDIVFLAVCTAALATSIQGLSYQDGAVLFSFPVGGAATMEYVAAVQPTMEGYVLVVHTGHVAVYCPDGALITSIGGDKIGCAGDGLLMQGGGVAVADWEADCVHVFSSSTGGLLHRVKSRNKAVAPFALASHGPRVYVMYVDGPAVHVLE